MQIIYFLILNFTFLAFLNSENAREILLTNLPNEMNPIQIPLTHKKNGSSSFGFHFKWVEGFCKPDGLLICYLSNLIIGGKMTKRFKIGQQQNSTSISEKCKEKIKLKSENGEIWNGILLEESSDLGRNFTMELALTGKKYYFDGNELTLEFGMPTKLKMNYHHSKIDQLNDEEKDLYTNFTEQMNYGPFFDDYLGIWALGMDLIPSNGETLQIYVFRSCDCTMKAWFLPNSSQEKMPEWGQIDKRIECPEDMQKNFVELPNPLEKGKMLNISLKLAENAITQVIIRLFHKWTQETWSKYVGAIIDEKLEIYWAKVMNPIEKFQKYNYGDLLNITIKLKGQSLIELENFDQKGSYNFDGIGNDILQKMTIIHFNKFVYLNSRICPPIGLFLNLLLFWLIWRKTPKEIVLYSRILYQTCILDILYLLQETIGWPVVIFFDGIFTVFYDGYLTELYKHLFGPVGLYFLYKVHQTFFAMDIFSVVFQFVHRYFLLNRNIRIPLCRYLLMLFALFLFNVIVMSIYFIHNLPLVIDGIRPNDTEFIGQLIENLDERKQFAFTVADKTPTYNKIWHFMVITTFIVCFSCIIILGYRIVHFVRRTSFSEYTRKLNKQLTKTLIILASFPLLAIAILVLFIIITVSLFGKRMARDPTFLQLQMATSFLQHYIPLLNPVATILINSPYRLAIVHLAWEQPRQILQRIHSKAISKISSTTNPSNSSNTKETKI